MVAATGTRPRAKKRSTAAASEDGSAKPPRKPRAPRRPVRAKPLPSPAAPVVLHPQPIAHPLPTYPKPSRWQLELQFAMQLLALVGVVAISAYYTYDFLKDSGQLVSQQSCAKLELDELRWRLQRLQERIQDENDPPPKGFASLR
jgi:hypothetical protein